MADDYPDDTSTRGVLPTGGMASGTLETAGDADWFRLDLAVGHGYLFTPSMADGTVPTVTVWNAATGMVAYTTAQGGLFSNELANPFVPFEAGSYYLEISGAATGSYTVGMREAPDDFGNDRASARLLAPDAPVAARFDYAFDNDRFRIAAVAGTTYTVTLGTDSGTLGTASFLRLTLDGDRYAYAEGGATTTYTFTAAASRDYFVSAQMASYHAPAAGGLAYHVSLAAADITGPRILAARGSVDGALRVTFDENLRLGGGTIDLTDGSGTILERWTTYEGQVHVDGATLTLDARHLHAIMPGNYQLRFGGDSVTDASGNLAAWSRSDEVLVQGTGTGGQALGRLAGTIGAFLGGGPGAADAVVYPGAQDDYTISRDGDVFRIDSHGGQPADRLSGIERVMFTQSADVVALSLDGHLGQAYRLYNAAFDRAPDKGGLGFWLHAADGGASLASMARGFIASQEFADLYGAAPDDGAFVAALYRNVLHRAGDQDGVDFWLQALGQGYDRAEVLAQFSESAENQAQAVALIGNGIVYTPYG